MLSEEEKKLLKIFKAQVEKEETEYFSVNAYTQLLYDSHKTVLNLITKLQKENEEKDKQIDLMGEYMEENMDEYQLDEIYAKQYNCNGMERNWTRGKEKEVKEIKQYFAKLAKEKGE